MTFRSFLVAIAALLVSALNCGVFAFGNATPAWTGSFVYEGLDGYDGGGTPATGDPIVLDMTLKIDPRGGCILKADGFQTEETLTCKAVTRSGDSGIDIHFAGFPPGAIEANAFFPTSYPPNALLFSLLTTSPGDEITTRWAAIKPAMVKTDSGIFFKRKF